MSIRNLLIRVESKYHRFLSYNSCRRMVEIKTSTPYVSFSFDDAPQTAFTVAGDVLKTYDARATFFVSMGLLGTESPSGVIAGKDDLLRAVAEGHELGCHTFDHKDPWETTPAAFEESVINNRRALTELFPGASFKALAYPYCGPRPVTKYRIGKLFNCCRGGGQAINSRRADFNLLKSFFLDRRTGVSIDLVEKIINQNIEARGWLIFSTHDVTKNPSPYGCTKEFFEKVVSYAARSGARLLPVGTVCQELQRTV